MKSNEDLLTSTPSVIRPTLALKKISKLKKPIWVIQGGQGAGKTFAILLILANHALSNDNKEILIVSKELSKMRITVIKDFVKILKDLGYYDILSVADTLFRFPSGSFVKFVGLDKEDIGKGLRSDVVFVNEANKISFESYRELTSRSGRVIIDFNPNNEFWAHTDVITREDAEFLILTYKDNEFLSARERNEINLYRVNAYFDPDLPNPDIDSNIKSKYWWNKWKVYGLGEIGSNPYRIFQWQEIPFEDYDKIDSPKYYGVDWGVVDPWAVIEAKYYDGNIYVHELNYDSENDTRYKIQPEILKQIGQDEEGGLVKWKFNQLNIDKKRYIICDNNRALKILALHEAGFEYAMAAPKPPGSIIDGLNIMSEMTVFFTSESSNIRSEQMNYSRRVDRYGVVLEEPEDKFNHLMDAIRYVVLFLVSIGVIRK